MSQELEAVSYCVGMSLGGSLLQQNLEGLSPEVITEAITDAFQGKQMKYTPDEANAIIQKYLTGISEQKFGKNKEVGAAFLAENGQKDGVTVTESGLQYEVIEAGAGEKPGPTTQVTVHYHGTLIDGTVFDSSVERGEPATFGVNQVIKGWTEALQLMPKGAKYRLYIPEDLAYGASPHPGGPIEPHMALIFDVELLEMN
ncbi:FKBP-type peptidyl-prolyl cis-trans isomerase [Crocinitomicaceae bacterium]|nr:FKBP-type peptidyl-prolyl cis-trans isomerase [Crocinitomicaceae bacterium]|mmetsp:Transcript_27169/g.31626  ORF Transcript_27169/g.31626 Transcript_27169/m.31626 type:complete len:200 (-) Transcript_27169:549-1148(-)